LLNRPTIKKGKATNSTHFILIFYQVITPEKKAQCINTKIIIEKAKAVKVEKMSELAR